MVFDLSGLMGWWFCSVVGQKKVTVRIDTPPCTLRPLR
jgi:hypothetical protein